MTAPFDHFPDNHFPGSLPVGPLYFPWGYWPEQASWVPEWSLYQLLPQISQAQSLYASGLTEEGDYLRSVLRKLVDCLDAECLTLFGELMTLSGMVDPDSCPVEYLPHLSNILGGLDDHQASDGRRRMILKAMAHLWRAKGQTEALLGRLRVAGLEAEVVECWKTVVNELTDYATTSQGHPLKAARVILMNGQQQVTPGPYSGPLNQMLPIHVRPITLPLKDVNLVEDGLGEISEVFERVES